VNISNNTAAHTDINTRIINKALEIGATSAGITSVARLKQVASYEIYHARPYHLWYEGVNWPAHAKSVVLLTLYHDPANPELDWWRSDEKGRTKGNAQLIDLADRLGEWLNQEFNIRAETLGYDIEEGSVFVKDASVLAGLGRIGKNNLLITPEHGPRVRIRAMFLDVELGTTDPVEYDPCEGCDEPCFSACPQDAFRSGAYDRDICDLQMAEDEDKEILLDLPGRDEPVRLRKYCRECDLACPVGK
jgi:epoxyqueuosine reductase